MTCRGPKCICDSITASVFCVPRSLRSTFLIRLPPKQTAEFKNKVHNTSQRPLLFQRPARKSTCLVVRMYIFTQCILFRNVFCFLLDPYLFSHSALYFQCWTYLRKWDYFGKLQPEGSEKPVRLSHSRDPGLLAGLWDYVLTGTEFYLLVYLLYAYTRVEKITFAL